MKKAILSCFAIFIVFTVFAQAPVISSFSPTSGTAGSMITIDGANLNNLTSLSVGNTAAIPISNTGSKLVAMVMPGSTTGAVSVTTSGGSSTGGGTFAIIAATYPKFQVSGKLLASDAGPFAQFGSAAAISADGNTAAIGGFNDSGQTGGVWVYVRNGASWVQQGNKIVPSDYTGNYYIGTGLALSADGNTMIVSGNQGAWIYSRNNGVWTQQTNRLIGSNAIPTYNNRLDNLNNRHYAVAISADGLSVLIGNGTDNSNIGAVWAYIKNGNSWVQQGAKIIPTGAQTAFGYSIAMSADGSTAVIGSPGDGYYIGAVYIFTHAAGAWAQQGNKIIASDYTSTSLQGASVAITANGNMVVAGGHGDNNNLGAAWVYTRTGNTWAQQAKLASTGITAEQTNGLHQGFNVATNADGTILLESSPSENNAGATWVYTRNNTTWTQSRKLVGAGNINQTSMALSADGTNALMGNIADNNIKGSVIAYSSSSYPVLITGETSGITTTSAIISGKVDDNGSATNVTMEYSTSPDMAGSITASLTTGKSPIPAGTSVTNFTGKLSGLQPGTTYYYRINGTNAIGLNTGNILSFLTLTPPVISSFTPETSGIGTAIIITGVNLDNITSVSIGGVPAAAFTRVSSTSVYAIVGTGATSGAVTITNGYGTGSLTGFKLASAPKISYPGNLTYDITKTITPVLPTNTGGPVPANTNLQITSPAYQNQNGNTGPFYHAVSSAIDPLGNIYVADYFDVKKISPNNQVNIYANFVQNAAKTDLYPTGVAVDATGTVFVSDKPNNRLLKITPGINTYAELFIGNGTKASVNGSGSTVSFNGPSGLVFDIKGNLYVAEEGGNLIRKITRAGEVSTFAGSGTAGSAGGTGTAASFNAPTALGIDAAGNIYVADKGNNMIRMISPAGVVTTIAGTGAAGTANGKGNVATFNGPTGITIDKSGNIYVADSGNFNVRMINPAGIVSTVAGSSRSLPYDGIGTNGSFTKPLGVMCDLQGNLMISDSTNVRKMVITGYTVTPDLPPGVSLNSADGTISGTPTAITNGTYTITASNVNGSGSSAIKITTVIPPVPPGPETFTPFFCKAGTTITINGINVLGATGVTIGGVPAASFTVVSASAITAVVPAGATSGSIVVSNQYGSTAIKGLVIINPPNITYNANKSYAIGTAITPVTVKNTGGAVPNNLYLEAKKIAGNGQAGATNGQDTLASFNNPTGTVSDTFGNIYVADMGNGLIRKITPGVIVSTFAGGGASGVTDGIGTAASFINPNRLAIDAANNLYVTDSWFDSPGSNDVGSIRKITPSGVVTTLAKHVFAISGGLTVTANGTIFFADARDDKIRKLTPSGVVTTYAGGPVGGSTNGSINNSEALFYNPSDVVSDPAGNFYVADQSNYKIRKISAAGIVSDFAGSGTEGYVNGTGPAAKFMGFYAVAIGPTGDLYVPDTRNNVIRKVSPTTEVTTPFGNGLQGPLNGVGGEISFDVPQGVSVDGSGNIFMTDFKSNIIRKVTTTGYSVSPALPKGLSLNGAGTISGVPTVITPATTYTITAYNVTGSSNTTINFATVATTIPPVVSSFSPSSGPVGTLVTITGSNLNYATVKIGGVNALTVSNKGTILKCLVMPGAVTGGTSVSTTAGQAGNAGNFTVKATPYPTIQQGTKLTSTHGNIGTTVAISADGNTILTPVYSQTHEAAMFFTRNNGKWTEQKVGLNAYGFSDASLNLSFTNLEGSVALSADGNTAAYGTPYSSSTGFQRTGAIWMFAKEKGVWKQQGVPMYGSGNIVNVGVDDAKYQGYSMAMSADGNTIIEGAPSDNNDQGAAWIFTRVNGVWKQQGTKLVGTGNSGPAKQGYAVNISADGNTAIVGGYFDSQGVGAAWLFVRNGDVWTQQGTKIVTTGNNSRQGSGVALSADGNTAIIGETGNPGGANVFVRTGTIWSRQGTELIGPGIFDHVYQGHAVALTADGNTAIGAGYAAGFTVSSYENYMWSFNRTSDTWKMPTYMAPNDFISYNNYDDNNLYAAITPDGKTAVMSTDFQGALWVFVAGPAALATTQAATTVGGSTATLNGVVNDGGLNTTVNFEYGISPTLSGATTAKLSTGVSPILPSTGDVSFTSKLTGLTPGTTYYFRIKAETTNATQNGDILSFTTAPLPPTITSFTPASTITGTEVTITGTNFAAVTSVSFGGTEATSFNIVSPTTITAVVGSGASGKVAVVTTGGTASLAGFSWVFSVPANNFNITAVSATCHGSSNGSITIDAAQKLNYTVTIKGGNVNNSYAFTDTKAINNLAAGTYNLCFTVDGQSNYSQCFTIVITEPKDLAVYTALNKAGGNVTLTLDGGNTYYVTLNGTTTTTTQSNLTLPLAKGRNDILIATDKPCQGTIEKMISLSDDYLAYPNPFSNTLYVNLGNDNLAKATLQLYSNIGIKVYRHQFTNVSGVVQIDPGHLLKGTYLLIISTGLQDQKIIKVVRE